MPRQRKALPKIIVLAFEKVGVKHARMLAELPHARTTTIDRWFAEFATAFPGVKNAVFDHGFFHAVAFTRPA
jgi:hypothetical protein